MSQTFTSATALIRASIRGTLRDKFFIILMVSTAILILGSVQFVRFGIDDFRLVTETTVTTTLLGASLLALLAGSSAVRSAREEQTIGAVMSKPVTQTLFLTSTYIGTFTIITLYVAAGLLLGLVAIFWKASEFEPVKEWSPARISAAFLLVLLYASIVAAVATTLSTLFKRVINLFITLTIFALIYAIPTFIPFLDRVSFIPTLKPLDCISVLSEKAAIPANFLVLAVIYVALLLAATILAGAWIFHMQEPASH